MENNFELPQKLYHYTSWSTFEKIIKNKTWRFSSINGTNDLSEDLNLYIKQLLSDTGLISNIKADIKQSIINYIDTGNYYGDKKYFMACFSEEEDDLGQWRVSYGDYGRGVCIGINPKFFTNDLYYTDKEKLGWAKVSYDTAEQKRLLLDITKKFEKYREFDDCGEINNAWELSLELRDIAMLMKHKAFNIEHEYRLIACMIGDQILDDNFYSLEDDLKKDEDERIYFIKNKNPNIQDENIVKCIDYDLNSNARVGSANNLITSIKLGKDCNIKEYRVKKILEENGFDCSKIEITKSNIPYRFSDDRKKRKYLY